MPADARLSAWLAAWNRLEEATKMLTHAKQVTPEYWAIIAQAEAYRGLAQVPEGVGVDVGEILRQEHIRKEESRQKAEDILGALNEYKAPKWKGNE